MSNVIGTKMNVTDEEALKVWKGMDDEGRGGINRALENAFEQIWDEITMQVPEDAPFDTADAILAAMVRSLVETWDDDDTPKLRAAINEYVRD